VHKKYLKKFITVLFFTVLFLPLVLICYSKIRISQIAKNSQDISSGWALSVNGNNIKEIDLPDNIYEVHEKYKTTNIVLRKLINTEQDFLNSDSHIFLGRIADIDEFYINGEKVGKTGVFYPNGRWDRSTIRSYPFKCDKSCDVEVHIQKIGTEYAGVYEGPIFISNDSEVKKFVNLINFFEKTYTFYFGFILVFVGFYYLFIFSLGTPNTYYSYFSLTSIFIGLFNIAVSRVLYGFSENYNLIFKVNAVACILAGYFYVIFLNARFLLQTKKILKGFSAITLVCLVLSAVLKQMDSIRDFYVAWFPFFIFMVFFVTYKILKGYFKSLDTMYFVVLSLIPLSIINDMLNVYSVVITFYTLPFAFGIIVFALALQLANETTFSHASLANQVDERTKDLSIALEQLKGLEKMKERFFANVSHDLKTPITIALGAIEEAKGQFKATMGKVLDPADRSLRRLQDMVMSILDNVKAESGTLALEWKNVKVGEFLKNVVEPYQSLCAREGVTLKYSSSGFEGLSVPMDPTKMDRVIENLLSNAVKFTKKTTRNQKIIEVSMKTDHSKLYIHIDDSGIGIPEAERQKVFERFFQSSITNLREHGGSGIGLSFVTEMIALHNGKVYADESPFHGTRMTIELPLSQSIDNLQSYRVQDTNPKILRGSLDVEYPPTTPEKFNAARMTLLVAEDNPEVAQIVYSTLKDQYNIYFAENGKRALTLLGEQKFDCIVSDIEMPEMSGDEFVEAARKENQWKSIPIIMLSSHGDDDTIVKLLNLGANDYVQKPFRREILLSRIHAQINAYRGTTWNTKMEKLQELGQLVSGIGHQGKNRISRIGSNYPLLIKISKDLAKKLEATQPEDAKRLGEKVEALGGLIGKGYEQTLDLFKAIDRYASGSEQKSPISIEEVFHDTLTLLEEKIQSKNISVQKGDFKNISFDGYNEFREAILNIVSNAVDAVEKDVGAITIHAESKDDTVFISITDNGCGIAKENISHVFEPFFTSKQVGQGTGLGLYLARDAIELKNQGKLDIISKGVGQGVTVNITVPKSVTDIKHDRHTMHNVGV
jgi:signal transduction histidine kinase